MANGSGVKTNERPGTRAVAKYIRISPYKVREVLNIIRGEHVQRAAEILRFSERDAAIVVGKVLASAVANAENNDGIDPEELYVSACYADEGVTIKRFRPRARGRAGRIRKRTCHITVIVSRLEADKLARYRTKQAAEQASRRARRVAGGRAPGGTEASETVAGRGRFCRNRGGSATAGNEPEQLDETELDQISDDVAISTEVGDDVEAADEAGVVDSSPVSDETEADDADDVAGAEDADDADEEESK